MSAKPGSWRGSFCRRARVQPGVRCFHRVGCEKSVTAGCPPNMENGAGFGRRQKFEQPLCRQPRLFRSAVGAFFAKRRAANPARPGRANGAKRRKQIFLKPAAACGGAFAPLGFPLAAALSLRSAFRLRRRSRSARFAAVWRRSRSARLSACGGALAPLGSPPASLAFPPRAFAALVFL